MADAAEPGRRGFLARVLAPAKGGVTRRILRGTLLVGGCTLFVKLVAFAKEITIASTFGRGDVLEAFLIALLFPTLVAGIIGGAFHQAFVPIYMRSRARDPAAAAALFRRCLLVALGVLTGTGLLLYASAPTVLGWIAGGYSEDKLRLAVRALRLMTPLCLLATLPGMLSGVLHARERFVVPALAQVAFPGLTLVLLAWFGPSLGLVPLVIGALGGYGIEAAVLVLALARADDVFRLRAAVRPAEFSAVLGQWLPAAGGMVIQNVMPLVDQAMAAHLAGGSVAALSYGYRLIALPLGVATLSIGTALLPVLSDLAARNDWDGFWFTVRRWTRVGLWGGLLPVVLLTVFAGPLIEFVYQRGSFDGADTAEVAAVLASYAGMIPFYVAGILGVRALTIVGLNRALLVISVVNLTANIAGNLILSRWFGVSGIAMSTVLVYGISTVLTFATLRRRARAGERTG